MRKKNIWWNVECNNKGHEMVYKILAYSARKAKFVLKKLYGTAVCKKVYAE